MTGGRANQCSKRAADCESRRTAYDFSDKSHKYFSFRAYPDPV
jgi:hypothetical protein